MNCPKNGLVGQLLDKNLSIKRLGRLNPDVREPSIVPKYLVLAVYRDRLISSIYVVYGEWYASKAFVRKLPLLPGAALAIERASCSFAPSSTSSS